MLNVVQTSFHYSKERYSELEESHCYRHLPGKLYELTFLNLHHSLLTNGTNQRAAEPRVYTKDKFKVPILSVAIDNGIVRAKTSI